MAKYLIVGGVAGGASTAARLRRLDEQAEIILFERGDYISYANCGLPYFAGGVIKDRDRLFVMNPRKFNDWFNVDVRTGTEVISIDTAARTVRARKIESGAETTESYDALVLSPGAEPLKPPIPGIDMEGILPLRSVPDIDRIKEFIDNRRPERALVIGGGFIGLEMAENLHARGVFVTIVEALDQVMNPLDFEMASLVHQQLKARNVELCLADAVDSFAKRGSRIVAKLKSGTELAADLVILSIGVRPDTKIAKAAGIALSASGAILVDERMKTSAERVYALGDAVAVMNTILKTPMVVPLAGPANKQARVVAENIVHGDVKTWNAAIGTSIAKVFDIAAAATGLSEKVLLKHGIPCATLITHGSSHAGYYPDALPVTIKTVFDPVSGRLYGAQVVGYDGDDKRIDVLSEFVRRAASVRELAEFEHAYAPPFSSAKDPVNIMGMAADNLLSGLTRVVSWRDVEALRASGAVFLDVRTSDEFSLGTIPGSVNMPNDQVRGRLAEIPRDRTVILFCGVGLRGYLAERILRQNGWTDIANLSGGYKTWELATERQSNAGIYKAGMAGIQGSSGQVGQSLLRETFSDGSGTPDHLAAAKGVYIKVDACGLQCPGPIMRLKIEMDKAPAGARIVLSATDPGFARDAKSWCNLTGNALVSLEESSGIYTATIEKGAGGPAAKGQGQSANAATLIVFSDDMDKALASFVLANGAVSSGKKTTMFFTFWGLSVLKRTKRVRVKKDFMGKMFGMMLPGNLGGLGLSKMNFAGMGPLMMRMRMKSQNVDMLETMRDAALRAGVRMIACQMSMDIMGVKREELIDGVEIGGVASYMESATEANVNLFI